MDLKEKIHEFKEQALKRIEKTLSKTKYAEADYKALNVLETLSTKTSDLLYKEMDKVNDLRHEIKTIISNAKNEITDLILETQMGKNDGPKNES